MSRVINTANPGRLRNQARRTIAEMLRHLMFKKRIDDESKDMAALVAISLQEIAATIDVTTTAWENRDYFLKADRFRLEWSGRRPPPGGWRRSWSPATGTGCRASWSPWRPALPISVSPR